MQLLIADSGATKTDWACIQNGKPVFMKTSGMHPAYMDQKSLLDELKRALIRIKPDLVLFYGAGCYSVEAAEPVRQLLDDLFPSVPVEIHDDLAAVAHAFLGDRKGVAAILGTGSNSGLFMMGKKRQSVASLGYVLGDEGSAADIGKRILRSVLREEFSLPAKEFAESVLGPVDYQEVVSRLYNSTRPSYYLAMIAEKVLKAPYPDEIAELVDRSIQSFVDTHLKKYEGFPKISVVLSGGVANHQKELVSGILERNSILDYRISGSIISALADRQTERMK